MKQKTALKKSHVGKVLCRGTKEVVGCKNRRKQHECQIQYSMSYNKTNPFSPLATESPNFAVMPSSRWYQKDCKKRQFVKQTHSCTYVI